MQSLEDLTYDKRRQFLAQYILPPDVPVISFHTEASRAPRAVSTMSHVAHAELPWLPGSTSESNNNFEESPTGARLHVAIPLAAAMAICALHLELRYKEKSDGLVTRKDAEVPGSLVVRPDKKLDHAWMVYSPSRKEPNEPDAAQMCEALITLLLNHPRWRRDEVPGASEAQVSLEEAEATARAAANQGQIQNLYDGMQNRGLDNFRTEAAISFLGDGPSEDTCSTAEDTRGKNHRAENCDSDGFTTEAARSFLGDGQSTNTSSNAKDSRGANSDVQISDLLGLTTTAAVILLNDSPSKETCLAALERRREDPELENKESDGLCTESSRCFPLNNLKRTECSTAEDFRGKTSDLQMNNVDGPTTESRDFCENDASEGGSATQGLAVQCGHNEEKADSTICTSDVIVLETVGRVLAADANASNGLQEQQRRDNMLDKSSVPSTQAHS